MHLIRVPLLAAVVLCVSFATASCAVYQSIYGRSTVGIDYDYFGDVDSDNAEFLQKVAKESVQEFFERN